MKAIWDMVVYIKMLKSDHLLEFYYLVFCKYYLKKKIWEYLKPLETY